MAAPGKRRMKEPEVEDPLDRALVAYPSTPQRQIRREVPLSPGTPYSPATAVDIGPSTTTEGIRKQQEVQDTQELQSRYIKSMRSSGRKKRKKINQKKRRSTKRRQ